jgi:hypothetical protein
MTEQNARAVNETLIDAVIVRCTCGDPASHPGAPCPQGVRQDLGTIAYWHKNPLRRFWWAAQQKLNGGIK